MHPPRLRLSATWGVILSCKFEEEALALLIASEIEDAGSVGRDGLRQLGD